MIVIIPSPFGIVPYLNAEQLANTTFLLKPLLKLFSLAPTFSFTTNCEQA